MTAELALGLVSVMLVLGLLLGVVATAAARLTCLDAARAAARVAATGESDAAVAEVARAVAGAGAQVAVRRDPPWVVVTVTTRAPGGSVGMPVPSGTATAWVEP